jgi:hypothetical protein
MVPKPTLGIQARPLPTLEDDLKAAIHRSETLKQRLVSGDILTELDLEQIYLLWWKGVWHPANLPRVSEPARLLEIVEDAVKGGEMIRNHREHSEEFATDRIKGMLVAMEADRDALAAELAQLQDQLKVWKNRAVEAETKLALSRTEVPCSPPKPSVPE